jgi:hypothetical protein
MQTRTAAIALKCRLLPRSRFKLHDWDAMSKNKPATAAAPPLTVQVAAR